MNDLINLMKDEIDENKRRDEDIPTARKAYESLLIHSQKLQHVVLRSQLWPAKAAQVSVILKGSCEINGGILCSLEREYLAASEALLRVSIEHSINIIYILSDSDIVRSRSFLKHAILDMEAKADKQKKRATREKDILDVFSADNNMDLVKNLKSTNPNLFKDKDLVWPNAYERFKECGLEKEYRNLFSTASDTVHSLSQDVLGLIFSLNMPSPLNQLSIEKNETYRKSLSIYFLLQALRLNSLAIKKVAEVVMYKDTAEITKIHDDVWDLMMDHEHEHVGRMLKQKRGPDLAITYPA